MANDTPGFGAKPQLSLDGAVRDKGGPPSDAEIALQMWRQHMGDKPFPERLRQKYGIPANTPGLGFPQP